MQNTAADLRDTQSQAGQATGVLQGANIDLVDKIRTLGTSLRTELSTRMDVVRAELEKRIEQLPSMGDLQDTRGRVQDLELTMASAHSTQEQLSEVFSLTQIITVGTEKLAERIASESANWRSGKLQSDARINYLEKIVGSLGGEGSVSSDYQISEPTAPEIVAAEMPTLMSEDLKDTLGALVSKLNKTLNVDPIAPSVVREASNERRRSASRHYDGFPYRSSSPPMLRAMSTDAGGGNPGLRSLMHRNDVRGGSQQPPQRGSMGTGQADLDRSNKSTPSAGSSGKVPPQGPGRVMNAGGNVKDSGPLRFTPPSMQGLQPLQPNHQKVSISPTSSISSNTTRSGGGVNLPLRPGPQQQQGPGLGMSQNVRR